MEERIKECPQCGRMFSKISADGKIGFCEFHRKWFPCVSDAVGEAGEANLRYQEEQDRLKEEKRQKEQQKELAEKRRRKSALFIKFLILFLLLGTVASALLVFKIIPEKRYKEAEAVFDKGDYRQAQELYANLNGFADSEYKSQLCDAYTDLYNGDLDSAEKKLRATEGVSDEDVFRMIYNAKFEICSKEDNILDGISAWDEFILDREFELNKYSLKMTSIEDGAALRFRYAEELAADLDMECILYYREASAGGVDVKESVTTAIKSFPEGKNRIKLQKYLLSITKDESEADLQKGVIQAEIEDYLNKWKEKGFIPQDVIELIQEADELGLEIKNRENITNEAALEAAKLNDQIIYDEFTDWDQDGTKELLIITSHGEMKIYSTVNTFSPVYTLETDLENPSVEKTEDAYLIIAEDQMAFCTIPINKGERDVYFKAESLNNLRREGNTITYGISLDGSIDRTENYLYSLDVPEQQAKRTEISWQKDLYPYPETPEEMIRRYYEAIGYKIEEEALQFIDTDSDVKLSGYTIGTSPELNVIKSPFAVSAMAFDKEEEYTLFEVTSAEKNSSEAVYIQAVNNEGWKIAGFSNTYSGRGEDEVQDLTTPLLAFNSEMSGHATKKGEKISYRLLLTDAGRVQLLWKAGEKEGGSTAFVLTLYDADDLTKHVISYDLKLSASKQKAPPLFLSPGVYYVQIDVKANVDTDYYLTMQMQRDPYIEQEDNNTPENANIIEQGQEYTGSLFEKSDVDYFSIALEHPGALNLSLSSNDDGSRKTYYTTRIYSTTSSKLLSEMTLSGENKQMNTGNLFLKEGTYLIQIIKGNAWTSWDYRLKVDVTSCEYSEQEDNNGPEIANEISVNQEVTGSFGVEGDIDYFTFVLEDDMVVQPKLTFSPLETSSKTYTLILSKNGEKLLSTKIGGKESGKVLSPLVLNAGQYLVRLENPNFVSQEYELSIAAVEIERAENEPNDELAMATELSLGQAVSGVLTTSEDIDLYKLTVDTEMIVGLDFSFTPVSSNGSVFKVSIEKSGKTLWSTSIKGEEGAISEKLQIPAGEYYLRVKPVNWISAVYKIIVG